MKASENAKHELKQYESLRLTAYLDSGGLPTIGYGHLILRTEMGRFCPLPCGHPGNPSIAVATAESLFDADLQISVNHVNAALKESKATLNQNQFDALVIFVFNIGGPQWHGSTARRDLVEGKVSLIPNEMMRWIHDDHGVCEGLKNRRAKEVALFKRPV